MNRLFESCINYMLNYGLKDIFELLFFVMLFYRLIAWLYKDRTHNLVWYTYGYCSLIIFSHYLNLSFMFAALVTFAPVAVIVVLFMHQDTLLKRFATSTKILPARLSTEWHNELMQTCLTTLNNRKRIICIIEKQDNLESFIITDYVFNFQLQHATLMLLVESSFYNEQALIWITSTGQLKGINCRWIAELSSEDAWTGAIQICSKTDSFAFKTNPESNSFDVVVSGNVIDRLSSTYFRTTLIQFLKTDQSVQAKKQIATRIKEHHENIAR